MAMSSTEATEMLPLYPFIYISLFNANNLKFLICLRCNPHPNFYLQSLNKVNVGMQYAYYTSVCNTKVRIPLW